MAEDAGPPHRRFWISRDPHALPGTVSGWTFIFNEVAADGKLRPGWDTWEQHFFEILRYPSEHASGPLTWTRVATGEIVELVALQEGFDGFAVPKA